MIEQKDIQSVKDNALSGDVNSAKRLARYYTFIDHNMGEAEKWLRIAASGDDTISQFNLASLLENKKSQKAVDESISWYQKAANSGDAIALKKLGNIYEKGEWVKKDYYEALNYYQKSALLGESQSTAKVIDIYLFKKDLIKAYAWLILAETKLKIPPKSSYRKEFHKKIEYLNLVLSKQDITKAKMEADNIIKKENQPNPYQRNLSETKGTLLPK